MRTPGCASTAARTICRSPRPYASWPTPILEIEIGPELDYEACQRALLAADIVLCPSRDDTLPITSLTALAAGKILVVSREVGTSAYIEDGVSGFVLRQNLPEEIAATLARIIAERARWPKIGEAARLVVARPLLRAALRGAAARDDRRPGGGRAGGGLSRPTPAPDDLRLNTNSSCRTRRAAASISRYACARCSTSCVTIISFSESACSRG